MKAIIALCAAGLLSACLLGCATPQRSYDDAKVAMIQKEVTTEANLLEWFGPPNTRTMAPDGAKALSWRFSPPKGHSAGSSGHLDVKLGTDGKVIAYSASAGLR